MEFVEIFLIYILKKAEKRSIIWYIIHKRRKNYMRKTIILDGEELVYELEYKNVKNINVRIKPGGLVFVSAGKRVPQEYIEDFFRKKSAEILRAVKKYRAVKPAAADDRLKEGSSIYYLGKSFRLKIESAASNMVTLCRDEIIVYSAGCSVDAVIDAWYDAQCKKVLRDAGHSVYLKFTDFVAHEPEYSFKKMKTLWGSCNPVKYRMSINRDLIKYDRRLIEFVFCHEYTHFIHPNHSPDFYRFMTGIMPDHDERKKELKAAALIIRDGNK